MSDHIEQPSAEPSAEPSRRGQALLELALVLPLLLMLLLGAIDFGRVFFGWVAVTNASRVAANYAATHIDARFVKADYDELIREAGADNCGLYDSDDPPLPVYPDGKDFGDRVRVDLTCEFTLVNPFIQPLVGPFMISATSTFNLRSGCVNCTPVAAGPPPPAQNHCRLVPNMFGLSIAGAKLKWTAAGFTGPFEPAALEDSRTVGSQTVDQGDAVGCEPPYAFFTSSVTVTQAAIVEPVAPDPCRTIPNVLGMTVAGARTTWESAGFDPVSFTPPTGADDQIVSAVVYTPPAASHGQCVEPDALAIEVQYVPPPPPPPPAPCKVPSFVNTLRADAQGTWDLAQFTGAIQYQGGNWTVIGRQDLVGGSYTACNSSVRLFR